MTIQLHPQCFTGDTEYFKKLDFLIEPHSQLSSYINAS